MYYNRVRRDVCPPDELSLDFHTGLLAQKPDAPNTYTYIKMLFIYIIIMRFSRYVHCRILYYASVYCNFVLFCRYKISGGIR